MRAVNVAGLLNQIEMYIEEKDLRKMGLTEEEIEGYFEFYQDTWANIVLGDNRDEKKN